MQAVGERLQCGAERFPLERLKPRSTATKEKPGEVVLVDTDARLSHLAIADDANSAASLILDGPSLTVSGTADVGKYNGSDGRFVFPTTRATAWAPAGSK